MSGEEVEVQSDFQCVQCGFGHIVYIQITAISCCLCIGVKVYTKRTSHSITQCWMFGIGAYFQA